MMPFATSELPLVLGEARDLHGRAADIIDFLARTGLSWGEARARRIADIRDGVIPGIRVKRNHPEHYDEKPVKGRRDRTTVPIPDDTLALAQRLAGGRSPQAYLISGFSGTGQIWAGNLRRALRWTKLGRGRSLHELRHPAATLWLHSGVDSTTASA